MRVLFTDEMIIVIVREQVSAEKTTDVCRRHALSIRVCKAKAREGDQLSDVLDILIIVWWDQTF